MLAGAALEAVAAQLMEAFRERGAPFEGVIFHGETGWHVMNRAGFCESALTSPIKDHEAFVIFDEARCRCAPGTPLGPHLPCFSVCMETSLGCGRRAKVTLKSHRNQTEVRLKSDRSQTEVRPKSD